MILVELGDGALEGKFAPRELELLDEVGGAGKRHPPSVLDQGEPDCRREMGFSPARRPEQVQVGALLEPAIAGTEGDFDMISSPHADRSDPP